MKIIEKLTACEEYVARLLLDLPKAGLQQYGLTSQEMRYCRSEICRKMKCKDIHSALIKVQGLGILDRLNS